MEKKVHFYHNLLILPHPPPYINVEFHVFHLTLTLNIDGGDVICAIITNSRHYFWSKIVDGVPSHYQDALLKAVDISAYSDFYF